jgi:hypothetical protein
MSLSTSAVDERRIYNLIVMAAIAFREKLSDAIRFWEIRRIFYNLWLAAIVVIYFVMNLPVSKSFIQADALMSLFILAVLANVAYCAAYPVDLFVQMSGVREPWRTLRWVLFVIGMVFAGILTRWFAIGMFTAVNR